MDDDRIPVRLSKLQHDDKGLVCRKCGCRHFRVIYTRPQADGRIKRSRQCRNCGRRMVTWEG